MNGFKVFHQHCNPEQDSFKRRYSDDTCDLAAAQAIIISFNAPEIPVESFSNYIKFKDYLRDNPICKSTKTPEKPQ